MVLSDGGNWLPENGETTMNANQITGVRVIQHHAVDSCDRPTFCEFPWIVVVERGNEIESIDFTNENAARKNAAGWFLIAAHQMADVREVRFA